MAADTPHPEYGSRAACCQCCGNAYDISGADGGRQSRAGRLEFCDRILVFLILFPDASNGLVPPVGQFPYLKETRLYGIYNSDSKKEDQQPWPPHQFMYAMYHKISSQRLSLTLILYGWFL